jgi:hypothetical protein
MSLESERKKLHKLINKYGTSDPKTIKQSQKLDKLILESMKTK